MRKIVHKLFWAWEFQKEEKWLNEMAAKGLCLVGVGFCRYEFEECLPGEYNIRLELLEHCPNHAESQQYISFVEETGAEQVGSITRWVYFRKKTTDGAFELFSDNASRIKHLNRILLLLGIIGFCNLYMGSYNIFLVYALHSYINWIGLINLLLGLFILYGFITINKIKRKLKKEQNIFE